MKDMKELLHSAHLTKTQKIIAEYVLDNASEACFMTSTELAEALQISHSSVMRFTKDLGFSGYTEFQRVIREQYNAYISNHSEASTIPSVKLNQSLEKLSQNGIVEAVQNITSANINSVVLRNPNELFEQVSDAIIHSHTKCWVKRLCHRFFFSLSHTERYTSNGFCGAFRFYEYI